MGISRGKTNGDAMIDVSCFCELQRSGLLVLSTSRLRVRVELLRTFGRYVIRAMLQLGGSELLRATPNSQHHGQEIWYSSMFISHVREMCTLDHSCDGTSLVHTGRGG